MVDEGSQLAKGCEVMRLNFTNIRGQLNRDVMVDFDTCPVGGHNFNGKVEQRICHIKLWRLFSTRTKLLFPVPRVYKSYF